MALKIKKPQNRNWYVFLQARIFNNGDIEIVAPSAKNKDTNISASSLIMAKLFFMFCSIIASRSYLDLNFLLGGI